MANTGAKIINLQDYLDKRGNAEEVLVEQRTALRHLDLRVVKLLSRKHILKDIQSCKDDAVDIEHNLVNVLDWLEDKISQSNNENDRVTKQNLLKQCEQLIARNERVKKNISDDMAACRYAEGKTSLDPIKIAGFLIGAPVGLVTLTKTFISDKHEAIMQAGEVGAAVGLLLAFHYQAKRLCKFAGKAALNTPKHFRALRKTTRTSAFVAALTTSVALINVSEIRLRNPSRSAKGAVVILEAKCG